MSPDHNYKLRPVCPECMSLSIKKSYNEYVCNQCMLHFEKPIKVLIMHKLNRCVDNDIDSRKDRYNKESNKIEYGV